MHDAAHDYGRTGHIETAPGGLVFQTAGGRPAHRAGVGKGIGRSSVRAGLRHRPHHLGDDVARPLDDHGIALAHVEFADFVLVVQGGAAHHHPAHADGLQFGHRGQHAGAAHLNVDAAQGGARLTGRELPGHGETRSPGRVAQGLLRVQIVHFIDYSVDLKGQFIPPGRLAFLAFRRQ